MSIRTEITNRQLDGRLRRFTALIPAGTEPRQIYMTPEVSNGLKGIEAPPNQERLFGIAQARLEQFINGDEFVCRVPPSKKSRHVSIAMLEPARDEVWEFRIERLRIFGRFAEKDVFIATNWALRQSLDDHEDRWRFAIQTSKNEWTKLFPAYNPLGGTDLRDYISNARTVE